MNLQKLRLMILKKIYRNWRITGCLINLWIVLENIEIVSLQTMTKEESV